MKLFSEIEKTIERGFRRWTEKVFGQAESDELLLVHRAMLEEIEGKIQILARGKRVFPYARVTVTLSSADADRRVLYRSAFGEGGRLETDVREALEGAECEMPRGFRVEVQTAENEVPSGGRVFAIEYRADDPKPAKRQTDGPEATPVPATGRLVVVKGKAANTEYTLDKPRTNIGRLADVTDSEERVVRRNDVVFEEGIDEANATVSRRHAHIRLDDGEYRVCDDESEFGTRVFRDGRPIEVPAGNRRGERLKPGDEIYLGRACLRFER
jgi:hypothetical protein